MSPGTVGFVQVSYLGCYTAGGGVVDSVTGYRTAAVAGRGFPCYRSTVCVSGNRHRGGRAGGGGCRSGDRYLESG